MPNFARQSLWFLVTFLPAASLCWGQVVGEIRVEGTDFSDPSEILKAIKTPVGASLKSPSTQQSLSEDLKRIIDLGRYDPLSVRVEEEGPEELKTLVFQVKEYPLVSEIRYLGNTKYKKKRLDEELGFEEDERIFFKPGLIDQFQEKLEKFYFSKGFSNVLIEGREAETADTGVLIEFVIEEGRKLKLQDVGFEGNVHFTDEELQKQVKTKPKAFKLFRRKFDEDQFDQDRQRLEYLYSESGFLEAKIEPGTRKLVKNDKRLEVNFDIDEGPQYRLGDIRVEGAQTLSRSDLIYPITVQQGETLDRPQLIRDLQEVRGLYWGQGFRLADIEPEIVPDRETGVADLYLRIVEGPRYRLRNVRIEGVGAAADGSTFRVPLETKDYVVKREFELDEGDVLDWDQIEETERELINLQYFERQENAFPPRLKHGFQIEPLPGTDQMDLLLQLEETNTGFIQFGGGFSTDFGPSLNIEFKDRNAFGRGWQYGIGAEIGSRRQNVDLTFYNPRVNNTDYSTRFELYGRRRERLGGREFGETRIGGAVTVGKQITDEFSASLGYRLERVEIEDVEDTYILRDPDDLNADIVDRLFDEDASITSGVEARISRDTRDYLFFPTSGFHDLLGLEVAGLGGDNNFVKLSGTFDRFLPLREKLVLAFRGHFALAKPYGDSEDMPLHERFYLGGSNSIRGFRIGGISPFRVVRRRVNDIDGNELILDDDLLIGGEAEWFTNLELRYRYNDTVQQVVFLDAGSVYEEVSDFDFSSIRASVGSGLRLNLFANALVRLDLGFPIAKESQDKTQAFQFNFGASF